MFTCCFVLESFWNMCSWVQCQETVLRRKGMILQNLLIPIPQPRLLKCVSFQDILLRDLLISHWISIPSPQNPLFPTSWFTYPLSSWRLQKIAIETGTMDDLWFHNGYQLHVSLGPSWLTHRLGEFWTGKFLICHSLLLNLVRFSLWEN